jgi:hypothetical protein
LADCQFQVQGRLGGSKKVAKKVKMVIWETFPEKTARRRQPIIRQLEQGGSWIRERKVA